MLMRNSLGEKCDEMSQYGHFMMWLIDEDYVITER
jgi:hypothetical protein